METITYENIKVEGFSFLKIRSLEIMHTPNEHGTAIIIGEVDVEVCDNALERLDETSLVHIKSTAKDQKEMLFIGGVSYIKNEKQQIYNLVTLKLSALSYKLDLKRNERSFQKKSTTYGEIIKTVTKDWATSYIKVSDKPVGGLVMQYNETDWDFAKRMAAGLGAPFIASITEDKTQLYIGLPPSTKEVKVETTSVSYMIDQGKHQSIGSNGGKASLKEDFSEQIIKCYEYLTIGDTIVCNGNKSRVKTVKGILKDGILQMEYGILHSGSSASENVSSIALPSIPNAQSSGKMMLGTVKAVEKDKVQVHLVDIDKGGYDGGGDVWFPYSTAYSSSDGSGWYCMPEEGDNVRVFFPSGNEADAFVASSVCVNPPTNTRDKSWKAPGGKEILLTDEGLYIIAKEGKIFINLTDEKGIEIISDSNISVSSDVSVNIHAGNDIKIVAENEIAIGTEEAYISLKKGSLTLYGTEVLIN